MSDTRLDFERQKLAEYKQEAKQQHERFCNRWCAEHGTNCPYYDAEQEAYDYEQCFRERGEV